MHLGLMRRFYLFTFAFRYGASGRLMASPRKADIGRALGMAVKGE